MRAAAAGAGWLLVPFLLAACQGRGDPGTGVEAWPPVVGQPGEGSPVLAPEEALASFYVPPGYRVELVAAEPLVEDPVALDFDADGRIWVVEMRGYMPNIDADGEHEPVGRIVVLEDTSGDGRMDVRTVFMDGLVLPRALKVLERGVLIGEPPHLWLARDTTGNLQADVRHAVRSDFGDRDGNPEHLANGLMWGLDNWIHNTRYDGRLRVGEGTLEHRSTEALGQWGISMDDAGRVYRNSNSDPLFVDLVPAHYFDRNPHLTRTSGRYQRGNEDVAVWPARPTPGVNRGYRAEEVRDDSTLARYTSASSLAVFRGDRLPDELRGDVFVPEPAGNLVQRLVLTENEDGSITARNPYHAQRADFLTSTDERFRPVNVYSAPDGTLYLVDMYRGVIQHRSFLTEYLRQYILRRDLDRPIGHGRIYRVAHESAARGPAPRLTSKTADELVATLEHSNGWWRDTAQRLLVERQAVEAAPALRRLALESRREHARLHALWTLAGMGEADLATLRRALQDPFPQVRAAAVRIFEPALAAGDRAQGAAIAALVDDPHPAVRRQVAASLGELPAVDREEALARVIERHGDDPIVVDLAISALAGREAPFLARILAADGAPERIDAVERLAATVLAANDTAQIRTVLAWIGDADRPAWQRLALLSGVESMAPDPVRRPGSALELGHRPEGVLAAAGHPEEEVRKLATTVAQRLHWPGKPRPEVPEVTPLTQEEQSRFEAGARRYGAVCAACHQEDGRGQEGMATPLVESEWVLGHPRRLIRIVLHGLEGEMLMPPMGQLSDNQVAAVLTYIRRAWGHGASPVDPDFVAEIRGETTGRDRPYTPDQLRAVIR
jgi:mono/diheme cytochrome c family protein/glucose/arabinose dehydrogenase